MRGDLLPVEGEVKRHGHLRLGSYNQHSAEILPPDKSPLEFMMEKYGEGVVTVDGAQRLDVQQWRAKLGCYGVRQEKQTLPMNTMSDGLKARVVFTIISLTNPHILLLDEPTNHLDMQCIDALAQAINHFTGGVVLVSHDFRLIDQVAKEIWVCDNKTVAPWKDNIQKYKQHLSKEQKKAAKARAKK
jgi:ATP-binding cassette subfamily F protein 2